MYTVSVLLKHTNTAHEKLFYIAELLLKLHHVISLLAIIREILINTYCG
jgi:hypothetical protein